MWPLLGGLISGGASLLGGIFSSNTSASNTQAQLQAQQGMQKESEEFNAGQAQINRDYQTQMSSTAYQRAASDMKAAGLNPMMMANGSMNASSPSGSTASVSTPSVPMPQNKSAFADLGDSVSKAVNSAIAVKTYDKMTEEIANLQAQQAKTSAETGLTTERTSTQKEETLKTANEAAALGLGMPGRRFSAKQAEDLLSMPDWLRSMVTQGAFAGKGISQAVEPVTDLISSAKGVRSLLQYPNNPTKKYSSFEDRWPD